MFVFYNNYWWRASVGTHIDQYIKKCFFFMQTSSLTQILTKLDILKVIVSLLDLLILIFKDIFSANFD